MAVAAPAKRRGRGGLRFLIVLVVIILIVVGLTVGLSIAAQAATSVGGTLTVFLPNASVARGGGAFAPATSGTLVQPGDSVQTDAKGRAQITLPDGTITRLATNTTITLSNSHFSKDGNLHDASIVDKIGRTLSTVQHLASGASFQVVGNSTTASVRGTIFEVLVNSDGTVVMKLFQGGLDVDGKTHVHLNAGEQVTIDAQGNIGQPGPIQPDPNDPFGPDVAASTAVQVDTTPGTEEDFIGPPLHNGEQQQYTYSFAGGADIKAALAYPGSSMELKIEAPDGHVYNKTDVSPVVIVIPDPPAGIYKLDVLGIKGLGADGESPFLAVAASEPCQTADINQNGAIRKSFAGPDLAKVVSVQGLSNLDVSIVGSSSGGAYVKGSASYNGIQLGGSVILYAHGGHIGVIALSASSFGLQVPAQFAEQQIASVIGQDPTNIDIGFDVERLFACSNVLMIDGRVAGS
ncbi:MAG TPA: FecR family protein [Candidatus Dormibacteraeota bacterium]|nr:FecR family protein [Candidatus Dormibacteraeota bacterium]